MSEPTTDVAELEASWARKAAMADLREATRAVAKANARLETVIRRAHEAGASTRDIGSCTGWHFTTVARFLKTEASA